MEPTRLEPTEEAVRTVRAFITRSREERERRLAARLEEANRDAEAIVSMIAERYRPRRIYRWGSLLSPTTFQEISDIDIAVEGITDPQTFGRLWWDAAELTSFPLDVVQWEHLREFHRRQIEDSGVLAYERPL